MKKEMLLALILGLVGCQLANAACPLDLKVSHGSQGQSSLEISFALTYHGSKPVEIRESDLPSGAIAMQVFQNDGKKTEVARLGYISDPGPNRMMLLSGHVYRSKIDLVGRFRDIATIIKKNSVTVKWSYTLTPIHGNPFPTISGSFVINRQL